MDAIDKQRWLALSPLLDQLLDREEGERRRWLDQLRARDATTAAELEALLARDQALSRQGFMDRPAAEVLGAAVPAALQGAMPEAAAGLQPDLNGQTIGPYALDRELGQGGMGTVWLARRADGRFQGEVAIKFLKAGLFGMGRASGASGASGGISQGDNGRFAREGQILARLSHPHIARLLDAGVHQGQQPYLVLEYVDGLPIDRYCHVHGLDVEARIRLFLDVLAAVAHAHQRLILHRDLKPTNILVTPHGEVKLLDFGIAKLLDHATQPAAATELTQLAGSAFTPHYAAPEQIQQGDVTTATDVYALGVLLYQLLAGRHPTADDTQTHLDRLKAVVELVPKRLSDVAQGQLDPVVARQARLLRGDLDTIVAKALKKAPGERYANAEQLAADLQRWLAHEPISARADTRLYVMGRFIRRHRWTVGAGSVATLALVGLTAFSALQAHRAEQAERQAQQRRQQAEDLLGYLLGDFADQLRPIGKLDLLDSVGSKALTYLSQEAGATPEERLQRAKALTVLGEVRVSKRDLDGANEPLAAAQRLLEGPPPRQDLQAAWFKAQGAAAFWKGHAHFSRRQFNEAEVDWRRYQAVSEAWHRAEPDSTEAVAELSYAENSLGSARLELADLPGAAQSFQHSITLKRQTLARDGGKDTSLRLELADSLSWLGTTLQWQGDHAAALQVFEEGVGLVAALRAQVPGNGVWTYREAVLRRWAGISALRLGRPDLAAAHLDQAVTMLQALTAQDPANANWRLNLLQTEAIQLEQAQTALSGPQRLVRWQALKARSEAMDRDAAAGTARRRLEHQFRIVLGLASALAAEGREQAAAAHLDPLAAQLRAELASRPDDLRFLMFHGLVNAARLRLLVSGEAAGLPARREALCREQVEQIGKIPRVIGVVQGLTEQWVQAQSCLGRGNNEDVQRARRWLAERPGPSAL